MVGLPDGEKNEDIYNGLDTILACDRQMDILPRHIRAMHAVKIIKISPCLSKLELAKFGTFF